MHPPRCTICRLFLVIAAFSVALAALKGNHVWFMGMSVMTIIGLLGAAIGASPEVPAPPVPPSRVPPMHG